MNYLLLKYLHIGLATLSVSGFILRWAWKVSGSGLSGHRITRVAPHVLDSVFLASGIMLAIQSHSMPWANGWLAAKVFGLVLYIVLGMAAMRIQAGKGRTLAFVSALLVFGWIVSVALSKSI